MGKTWPKEKVRLAEPVIIKKLFKALTGRKVNHEV